MYEWNESMNEQLFDETDERIEIEYWWNHKQLQYY